MMTRALNQVPYLYGKEFSFLNSLSVLYFRKVSELSSNSLSFREYRALNEFRELNSGPGRNIQESNNFLPFNI